MGKKVLRSSQNTWANSMRLRERRSSPSGSQPNRVWGPSLPDWTKYVLWSDDQHATCSLCNRTLSTPYGKMFSFRRHLLGLHSKELKSAALKKRSTAARPKLKNAAGRKRNGTYRRVLTAALRKKKKKKNKTLQADSCVHVDEPSNTSDHATSSCAGPPILEICAYPRHVDDLAALENAKPKSPPGNEGQNEYFTKQNDQFFNTNCSGIEQFANHDLYKLTDNELATICSFEWQLHGKRSSDGKQVICKWCEVAFAIHGQSLLEDFVKHLMNWHKITFLNGCRESAAKELRPETNIALDGYYLFCDMCSSAIFITFADFKRHLKEHHGMN
ncbi:Reverse transcriptase [Trichuris trichiura]|uniref:Reverse transcriptase n=1 Tax=Trichuris trichiura TaxID=36087 RepID=A0A077Z000_TRITR|nr:Reverse transcriptase [Trichuris trichiura]